MRSFLQSLVGNNNFPKSAWYYGPTFKCYFRYLPGSYFGKNTFVVANIVVNDELRGKGVFTKLLVDLENMAVDFGVTQLKVESVLERRLVPFLEKNGFVSNNEYMTFCKTLT